MEATAAATDEGRQALLEAITGDLGDDVVGSHLIPGKDLWVRVATSSWGDVADYLRNRQQFRFFSWLSAIDWMPSPFGRSLDSSVDVALGLGEGTADDDAGEPASGYTGGDTRFQVVARVHNLTTDLGLTIKADVPGEGDGDLEVATWTGVYPGAEWHEREAWEMFGISFSGHPGLRHIYLPGGFEGHPLRKDYPLLARLVKPWPGIVDVEPMPEAPSTDNPEDVAAGSSEGTPRNPEDVAAGSSEGTPRNPEDSQ